MLYFLILIFEMKKKTNVQMRYRHYLFLKSLRFLQTLAAPCLGKVLYSQQNVQVTNKIFISSSLALNIINKHVGV